MRKFHIHNVFNNGWQAMNYRFEAATLAEAQEKFTNTLHAVDKRGHNDHLDRMELKEGRKVFAMQRFEGGKML